MKCCVSTYVGTWTNWLTFEPDVGTGLFSSISYELQRGILLRPENPTYFDWAPVAAATRGFKIILFTASRGNNFVGGNALHRVPFSFSQPNVMVKFRRVHFCGSVNTGWVLKNVWLYLENFTRRAHCYYATLIASRTSIRGAFCDDALYKLTFTFTYHLSKRVFSNDLEWLYEVPSQLMEASPSWKST